MPRLPAPNWIVAGAVLAGSLGACAPPKASTASSAVLGSPSAVSSPSAGASRAVRSSADASASGRPVLPAAFPVMPGAVAVDLPDDPTLIARWTIATVGSAAYDFYSAALLQEGYPIVGLYPAEHAALIRFQGPGGTVWQLVAEQVGEGTQITVQTDRR
jgi:hypothetical protein